MTAQWSAIPTHELLNTRREWFDRLGNFNAQVSLEVAYDNRWKLVQDLYTSCYGNSYNETNGGYLPRAYPAEAVDLSPGDWPAPDLRKIGVISARITDTPEAYTTDAASEVIHPKNVAVVEVQYGAYWNIQEKIEFEVEQITQSQEDFRWKTKINANDLRFVKPLEVPAARIEKAIITREFIGLSGLPAVSLKPDIKTLLQGVIGCTNATPYTSQQLGFTFDKETLLMLKPTVAHSMDMQSIGAVGDGSYNNFGGQGYSVTVSFLYKKVGHNKFWRPRMPQGDGSTFHGWWDELELMWEAGTQTGKQYKPHPTHQLIDQHWLIQAQRPVLAPA